MGSNSKQTKAIRRRKAKPNRKRVQDKSAYPVGCRIAAACLSNLQAVGFGHRADRLTVTFRW